MTRPKEWDQMDTPRRGRSKNLKANAFREQLNATILDVDYCEGRLLRWASKLAKARTKRKRLERSLATELAKS